MTTQTATIAWTDYEVLLNALRAIKNGTFSGALEDAGEGRWHEYASKLQQIAHDALRETRHV